jgi:hypothetical protein
MTALDSNVHYQTGGPHTIAAACEHPTALLVEYHFGAVRDAAAQAMDVSVRASAGGSSTHVPAAPPVPPKSNLFTMMMSASQTKAHCPTLDECTDKRSGQGLRCCTAAVLQYLQSRGM